MKLSPKKILSYTFTTMLVLFTLVLLAEGIFPKTGLKYIEPDYFLAILIILGIPAFILK